MTDPPDQMQVEAEMSDPNTPTNAATPTRPSAVAPTAEQSARPSPDGATAGLGVDSGGSRVLYRGRTHPKILFRPLLVQALLLTGHVTTTLYWPRVGWEPFDRWSTTVVHATLAALMLWYVATPILKWRMSSFEVTERAVRASWGILYKHSREIPLDRINQVLVERGILDRMFGCGTLVIFDAANSDAIRFHDVPDYSSAKSLIDDARERLHQTRAGWSSR